MKLINKQIVDICSAGHLIVAISFDIRNAFNLIGWNVIHIALARTENISAIYQKINKILSQQPDTGTRTQDHKHQIWRAIRINIGSKAMEPHVQFCISSTPAHRDNNY